MPARVRNVLRHVLADVAAELRSQLLHIAHEVELSLLHSPSRDARGNAAHQASRRALRDGATAFAHRFLADVERGLAGLRAAVQAQDKAGLHRDGMALSLVEDDLLDDDTLLEAIAARAESRNSLALQLLGHRMGVLAGSPALWGDALPLGPRQLVRALKVAAAPLALSHTARQLLFAEFEKQVMASYPALLEVIHARLVADGILPHLRFVPIRPRPAGVQASGRRHEPSAADAHAAQGAAKDPSPGGSPPRMDDNAAVDERFAALQGLLQRRRLLMAKLRPARDAESPIALSFNEDGLDAALQRMRSPSAAPSDGHAGNALAQLRHLQGLAARQPERDALELLGMFLEQLQRELRTGSAGELLLRRLRLPLVQLAVRDQAFFVDAGHPGRQLLDAVSVAGARWLGDDDLDPHWLEMLRQAVVAIEQAVEANSATFADANRSLQEQLQLLARRNGMTERRQVEAARGREKLALARLHAREEIANRVQGRTLPRFTAVLLDQAWADVLALGHLRNGEGTDGWQQLLLITERIIARALGELHGPPDPVLLERILTSLEQVGYHPDDARAIAAEFSGTARGHQDLTSRTELLLQLRNRARLGEGVIDDGPRAPLPEAASAALERMKRPGARHWIEWEEPSGQRVRRHLAWASARTGQTLLLNRRGQRVPGDDLDTLARRIGAGEAQLLAVDLSPAEMSWQAVTRALQQLATDHAARTGAPHGH